MKRFLATFALLLASMSAVAAEEQPGVDEILAHHFAARGGVDKLRALHSVVSHFAYHEPDTGTSDATMVLMRPYYKLVGDPDHPSPEFSEGWDGSAWEFYGDPGIVLRTVGAASAATRHHASLDGPLLDYRQHGSSVTLEGIDIVDGHAAFRLRVRMMDGFEEDELIDKSTWMLVGQRKVAKVHAFGTAVSSETHFSDFRIVDGVKFPFRDQEVDLATGKILNESVTKSIELDRAFDRALFSPPVVHHTELQRFLELLFAERDDVQSVLWSYADFRRAHVDLSTDVGMQVIGYQMLKMGEPAAAIALLERNAHDYPLSSNAAFGLGRAYVTAGRAAEGRAALQRALELDPKNQRAKSLLKESPIPQ